MRLKLDPVPRTTVVVVSEPLLNGGNEDESLGRRVVPLGVRDEAADDELLSVVLGLTPCDSSEPEGDGEELVPVPRNDVEIVEEEPVTIVLELAPTASFDEELGCEKVSVAVDSVMLAKVTFGEGPPPVPEGGMYEPVPLAFVGGFQPVHPVKVVLLLAHGGRVEFPPKLDESGVGSTVIVVFSQEMEAEVVLLGPMLEAAIGEVPVDVWEVWFVEVTETVMSVVREKVRLVLMVAFPVEEKLAGRDGSDGAPVEEVWPDTEEFDALVSVTD